MFVLALCLLGMQLDVFAAKPAPKEEKAEKKTTSYWADRFAVEARFSGQFFITSLLNEIYGSGVNYEVLGTFEAGKGLGPWLAVDYFYKKGHSETGDIATRMTLVPISIGARYSYHFGNFCPYAGVGLKYYFLHLHNYSSLVVEKISKNAPGLVAEMGCKYVCWKGIYLDSFFNYSYVHFSKLGHPPKNIVTSSLTLQSWSVGGGVGYQF